MRNMFVSTSFFTFQHFFYWFSLTCIITFIMLWQSQLHNLHVLFFIHIAWNDALVFKECPVLVQACTNAAWHSPVRSRYFGLQCRKLPSMSRFFSVLLGSQRGVIKRSLECKSLQESITNDWIRVLVLETVRFQQTNVSHWSVKSITRWPSSSSKSTSP